MKHISIILTLFLAFSYQVTAQETEFNVNCKEKIQKDLEFPNEEGERKKVCKFKNYLFKSIGFPDYKGRYSYYEYELLQIEKTDTIKIKNFDFFNEKAQELEKLINEKLKTEYEYNLKIPEIKECMKLIDLRYYNLNEFGISFDYKKQMEFHIDFGTISACLNVGGSIITLNYSEIEKYLK
tara:strand:+ start:716 stop:1258 length:543 start_codon:yes stop_codon:yes gene_type:complete